MGKSLIVAVMLLALTGCSSAGAPVTVAAKTAAPAASTAPIVMDPNAPTSAPTATASPYGNYTQDEFYLASLKGTWHWGTPPTGDQFISAGHLACKALLAGTRRQEVRVIKGVGADAKWNNDRVVATATQVYCPETLN